MKRRRTAFSDAAPHRTRRIFSQDPASLESVSKLLQTTWGVQGYIESPGLGPLALKTSPSGGARHPIEVYLMALRVDGLDPGLYHYDARDHALELISTKTTPQMARDYCADQPYVADAASPYSVMTALFARTMWKYQHPRAYRVVLLDAGHLGQTFCLTATRMGLAPLEYRGPERHSDRARPRDRRHIGVGALRHRHRYAGARVSGGFSSG